MMSDLELLHALRTSPRDGLVLDLIARFEQVNKDALLVASALDEKCMYLAFRAGQRDATQFMTPEVLEAARRIYHYIPPVSKENE